MTRIGPADRVRLIDALGEAQRIGMLGAGDLSAAVEQSAGLAHLIPLSATSFVDLGSGGGLPGLVVALCRPDMTGTLVDRRGKRVDLLVRLIGRLGISDRIEALESDVADLPRQYPGRHWSVVTSRSFGQPGYTAEHAAPLVVTDGLLLVTEPPGSTGSRWQEDDVLMAGFTLTQVTDGVAVLRRL